MLHVRLHQIIFRKEAGIMKFLNNYSVSKNTLTVYKSIFAGREAVLTDLRA